MLSEYSLFRLETAGSGGVTGESKTLGAGCSLSFAEGFTFVFISFDLLLSGSGLGASVFPGLGSTLGFGGFFSGTGGFGLISGGGLASVFTSKASVSILTDLLGGGGGGSGRVGCPGTTLTGAVFVVGVSREHVEGVRAGFGGLGGFWVAMISGVGSGNFRRTRGGGSGFASVVLAAPPASVGFAGTGGWGFAGGVGFGAIAGL